MVQWGGGGAWGCGGDGGRWLRSGRIDGSR